MTVMDGFKTRVTRLLAKYSIPAAARAVWLQGVGSLSLDTFNSGLSPRYVIPCEP